MRRLGLVFCGTLVLAGLMPSSAVSGSRSSDATTHRTILLGRSVDGRPITATETGDGDNPTRTLVVGCIHGNEPAGIAIWFHQHLDVVDDSTGSRAIERRFAGAAGLRMAALTPEPGSAVTWQTHRYPGATAFVVELPPGALTPAAVRRFVRAVGLTSVAAGRRAP